MFPVREVRIFQLSPAFFWTAALGGLCLGLGVYTFHYGEGLSYFSTDPKACANCHIMNPQYDGWQKAGHHTAATCIDCHLPHSFIPKYLAKARNGFFHSKGFTLQDFSEPIVIGKKNLDILHENCLHCHEDLTHDLVSVRHDQEELNCVHCHRHVGHGESVGMGKWEPVSAALLRE